jgi:hypothetical protein
MLGAQCSSRCGEKKTHLYVNGFMAFTSDPVLNGSVHLFSEANTKNSPLTMTDDASTQTRPGTDVLSPGRLSNLCHDRRLLRTGWYVRLRWPQRGPATALSFFATTTSRATTASRATSMPLRRLAVVFLPRFPGPKRRHILKELVQNQVAENAVKKGFLRQERIHQY